MSYILDALKKSHHARRGGTANIARESVHRIAPSLQDNGLWFTGAIMLLMGLTVVVFFYWRNMLDQAPVISPERIHNEAVPQSTPASVKNETPQILPVGKPGAGSAPVRDLAEEARVSTSIEDPPPQQPVLIEPETRSTPGKSMQKMNSYPATSQVSDDTPLLQHMPTEFQQALPRLAITIHVYSSKESQRILFVNNREYRKGDYILDNVLVEQIVPDGAILSFKGEHFKLERPR